MPKALKVILAVVGALCLLCVVAAVVGIKLAKEKGREMLVEGHAAVTDGRGYAAGHDGSGCLTEGLRRTTACTGFVCEGMTQVFTRTCLESAADSPGMCANVPPESDFMATTSWSIGRCDALGHNGDQKCLRLVKAVQQFCIARMFRVNQTGGGNPGATGLAPAQPTQPAQPAQPTQPTP